MIDINDMKKFILGKIETMNEEQLIAMLESCKKNSKVSKETFWQNIRADSPVLEKLSQGVSPDDIPKEEWQEMLDSILS